MNRNGSADNPEEFQKAVYRIFLGALLLVFVAVVLAIPSYFETTTLWYKTGIDKKMLIAGQYLGLLALVLLYLQIVLSLRGSFLSRVFGTVKLMRLHKFNALFIASLAAAHILLVLIPEGLANLPIGKKFWPEMVGSGLFVIIAVMVASSYFRERLRLPFRIWRIIHKPAGYLALLLVTIHVLFVSESFEQLIPRISLITLFALTFIGTAVVKIRTWKKVRFQLPRRLS